MDSRFNSINGMYQGWRGLGARRIKVTRTTLGVGVTCVSRFQDGCIFLSSRSSRSSTWLAGLLIRRPRYSVKQEEEEETLG